MAKSATFGALHLVIAFSVGYALTGSFAIAGAITLIEPLVNTVAHYFFDGWWTRREARRAHRRKTLEAAHGDTGKCLALTPAWSSPRP